MRRRDPFLRVAVLSVRPHRDGGSDWTCYVEGTHGGEQMTFYVPDGGELLSSIRAQLAIRLIGPAMIGKRVDAGGHKGGARRQRHAAEVYEAMLEDLRHKRPKATKTMLISTVADRLGVSRRTAWRHLRAY